MAKARVELDENLHAALSLQAVKARVSLKDYVGSILLPSVDKATWEFLGIDPKAKTTKPHPSATDRSQKDVLSPKQPTRRGPLLATDSRKQQLIEMVKQPDPPTLDEMGARLGGYDKGAVSRAISKLRESGDLEGEEATS